MATNKKIYDIALSKYNAVNNFEKQKEVICNRIKYGRCKLILLESIKTNTVCRTHC